MREIPIENIYYIVLYAWDKIKNKNRYISQGTEHIGNLNDVLLDIFLKEVGRLSKRGLYGEYIEDNHETAFIKGKVNIRESLYYIPPKLSCRYDEFSKNNQMNQLLKAILFHLYYTKEILLPFKKRIKALLLEFQDVDDYPLHKTSFQNLSYNRLNRDYTFPIDVGYLLFQHAIPKDKGSGNTFLTIDRDEEQMNMLFEHFLKNFYKVHTNYHVSSKKYIWDLHPIGNSDMDLIPTMQTDVQIQTPTEKIIIDAKYYKSAFTFHFDKKRFISNHMYQMNAYLAKNKHDSEDALLRGILIYPSNGYEFHERFLSDEGYTMEFKTVNLNKKWTDIERDLFGIFEGVD